MKHTSNATWAGMISMGLQYFVYCEPCEKHVEIDMTKLPPDGNAIGRTFRCRICGRPGTSSVNARSVLRTVPGQRQRNASDTLS
jgi:hypothetical protein